MITNEITDLTRIFERVSRRLTYKWGMPWQWTEFYSEMCYAFVTKNGRLKDKPLAYTITACKNEALNNYFKGKSIDAKPRNGISIISLEQVPEMVCTGTRFEYDMHNRLLIEKIFGRLTTRETQVAELIMEGNSLSEIGRELRISASRVFAIREHIRAKAKRIVGRADQLRSV